MPARRNQFRDPTNQRFAYTDNWDRLCVCGHKLGCHVAGGFDCLNDEPVKYATGEPCDCKKFRPSKAKRNLSP